MPLFLLFYTVMRPQAESQPRSWEEVTNRLEGFGRAMRRMKAVRGYLHTFAPTPAFDAFGDEQKQATMRTRLDSLNPKLADTPEERLARIVRISRLTGEIDLSLGRMQIVQQGVLAEEMESINRAYANNRINEEQHTIFNQALTTLLHKEPHKEEKPEDRDQIINVALNIFEGLGQPNYSLEEIELNFGIEELLITAASSYAYEGEAPDRHSRQKAVLMVVLSKIIERDGSIWDPKKVVPGVTHNIEKVIRLREPAVRRRHSPATTNSKA